MGKPFWAALLILIAAFIALDISLKNQEKKNAPVKQTIENAKITVTAPPLSRQTNLEQKTKEKLKEKVTAVYFYTSSYKNADYLVQYCEYKSEIRLQTAVDSIVSKFKDKKLEYETEENEIVDGALGILFEGSFYDKGRKFGIKEQIIKKKTAFWQILTIYPYSDKNNKAADSFISSISIGSIEK